MEGGIRRRHDAGNLVPAGRASVVGSARSRPRRDVFQAQSRAERPRDRLGGGLNVLDLQISSMRKKCAQKLVCPSHLVTDRQLYDTNPYNVNRVKPARRL